MKDLPVIAEPSSGCGNLQRASGVAGRDHVRLQRGDVARLALAKLRRRLRLYEIVDAGAPAADVRFGRRQQLDSGNRGEQLARLRANTLGMREVTRIVIDDARLDRMPRRARLAGFDQRFGDVAHLRAEGTRTIRPRGIVVK